MFIWAFPLHLDMFIKWALTGVRYYVLCSIKEFLAIFERFYVWNEKKGVFFERSKSWLKTKLYISISHLLMMFRIVSIFWYMHLGYVVKRQDGSNYWRHCYVLNCKWRKWSSYRRSADETAPTGIVMRLPNAHWCVLTIHSSIRTECHGQFLKARTV